MPNVDKTNEQEPTEGPKTPSGVSSQLAEDTSNRLTKLESKFTADVKIYAGHEPGYLSIVAFGDSATVDLNKTFGGRITDQDTVEDIIADILNGMRHRAEERQKWEEWLREQGWNAD